MNPQLWHLITVTFGTHVDRDLMVVEVATERWHVRSAPLSKAPVRWGCLIIEAGARRCSGDFCSFVPCFLELRFSTHSPDAYCNIPNAMQDSENRNKSELHK